MPQTAKTQMTTRFPSMNRNALIRVAAICTMASVTVPAAALELNLQTPAPVIHLAENLDEKDGLGWCIDTLGRGFSNDLQVHSCKPQGGDVQFAFEAETGAIRSVAFPEYCATHRPDAGPTDFGLVSCSADDPAQRFTYDTETGALSPAGMPTQCLAAGAASKSAGPFMSRDLLLSECDATEAALRRWVIRN